MHMLNMSQAKMVSINAIFASSRPWFHIISIKWKDFETLKSKMESDVMWYRLCEKSIQFLKSNVMTSKLEPKWKYLAVVFWAVFDLQTPEFYCTTQPKK